MLMMRFAEHSMLTNQHSMMFTDLRAADSIMWWSHLTFTFLFSQQAQVTKRLDAEEQRKDRTREEMVEEATELRKLF